MQSPFRLSISVLVFEKLRRAHPSLNFASRLVGKLLTNLDVPFLTSLLGQRRFKVKLLPLHGKLRPPENRSHPGSRHPYFQLFPPNLRDEIPVLQFFSPRSMNLKTEKSPVTINKLISRSLCIHFYTLSIHGSPVLPPLNSSQSLILLYLQCLFSGVSMYPTTTDFYLTLFPLHTHTHKKLKIG